MNQDPNFPRFGQQQPHQYGLHSFDTPPPRRGLVEKVFGPGIAQKFSSPLFATAAFVIAGVAFAGVIIAVYPDSADKGDVPVVQAETLAYKEAPSEPGGMSIPNRDSTVFAAMGGEQGEEPAPIENLLAEDEPVDKLAAFARQVEEAIEEDRGAAVEESEEAAQDLSTMAASEAEAAPVTLQKIAKQGEDGAKDTAGQEVAQVMAPKPPPPVDDEGERRKIIHKPGENPETLDFVRSVLDKKDNQAVATANDVATRAASVQPAAGNAKRDFSITPGSYYVQLGSVKSLAGAEAEWGKLQKSFDAELSSSAHRVQAADLGERGTFYRIQAGPMSKTSAAEICDSIKAQKPGGCLVTQ